MPGGQHWWSCVPEVDEVRHQSPPGLFQWQMMVDGCPTGPVGVPNTLNCRVYVLAWKWMVPHLAFLFLPKETKEITTISMRFYYVWLYSLSTNGYLWVILTWEKATYSFLLFPWGSALENIHIWLASATVFGGKRDKWPKVFLSGSVQPVSVSES